MYVCLYVKYMLVFIHRENTCNITRGLYMTLMSLLIPHVDHTPHIASIEQLLKDARDDLISGRLQGLPLSKELPSALLTLIKVTKNIVQTEYIPLLVCLYPINDDVTSEILDHMDKLTDQQLSTIATSSVYKASVEAKEDVCHILTPCILIFNPLYT